MSTLAEFTFKMFCIEGEDDGIEVSVNAVATDEGTEIKVFDLYGVELELMPGDYDRAMSQALEVYSLIPTPEVEPNPLQKEHWE